jgi:hypothetical protein
LTPHCAMSRLSRSRRLSSAAAAATASQSQSQSQSQLQAQLRSFTISGTSTVADVYVLRLIEDAVQRVESRRNLVSSKPGAVEGGCATVGDDCRPLVRVQEWGGIEPAGAGALSDEEGAAATLADSPADCSEVPRTSCPADAGAILHERSATETATIVSSSYVSSDRAQGQQECFLADAVAGPDENFVAGLLKNECKQGPGANCPAEGAGDRSMDISAVAAGISSVGCDSNDTVEDHLESGPADARVGPDEAAKLTPADSAAIGGDPLGDVQVLSTGFSEGPGADLHANAAEAAAEVSPAGFDPLDHGHDQCGCPIANACTDRSEKITAESAAASPHDCHMFDSIQGLPEKCSPDGSRPGSAAADLSEKIAEEAPTSSPPFCDQLDNTEDDPKMCHSNVEAYMNNKAIETTLVSHVECEDALHRATAATNGSRRKTRATAGTPAGCKDASPRPAASGASCRKTRAADAPTVRCKDLSPPKAATDVPHRRTRAAAVPRAKSDESQRRAAGGSRRKTRTTAAASLECKAFPPHRAPMNSTSLKTRAAANAECKDSPPRSATAGGARLRTRASALRNPQARDTEHDDSLSSILRRSSRRTSATGKNMAEKSSISEDCDENNAESNNESDTAAGMQSRKRKTPESRRDQDISNEYVYDTAENAVQGRTRGSRKEMNSTVPEDELNIGTGQHDSGQQELVS